MSKVETERLCNTTEALGSQSLPRSWTPLMQCEAALDHMSQAEQGCVPIRLHRKSRWTGQTWPTGQSLPSPVLDNCCVFALEAYP